MLLREWVWIGRDNLIRLQLMEDGAPIDLSIVTRYVLRIGDAVVDSDTHPAAFAAAEGGVLTLRLGDVLTEPVEGYAQLTLYDDDNPGGIVWADEQGTPNKLRLVVRV